MSFAWYQCLSFVDCYFVIEFLNFILKKRNLITIKHYCCALVKAGQLKPPIRTQLRRWILLDLGLQLECLKHFVGCSGIH